MKARKQTLKNKTTTTTTTKTKKTTQKPRLS